MVLSRRRPLSAALASAKDRVYGLLTHPTVTSLCPRLGPA